MFCTNCGAKVEREDSAFCPMCGAPLGDAAGTGPTAPLEQPATADVTAKMPRPPADGSDATAPAREVPEPVPGYEDGGAEGGEGRRRRPRRGLRVALVVALVLLAVAGAGAGVWWKVESDRKAAEEAARQAAWDAEHAERAVHLSLVAPNYDDAATRIPLRVTGTDLDQQAVDQVFYVNADTSELRLRKGDYQVSVVASPILQDGSLYALPAEPTALRVGDDTGSATGADDGSDDAGASSDADGGSTPMVEVELETIDDLTTVTDDQIAAARAAAEADPDADQAAKAGPYAEAATKRRDDAVAAKKAAEEEAARQKAAEEEARKKAEEESRAASARQRRSELALAFAEKFNETGRSDGEEGSPGIYFLDFGSWKSDVLRYLDPSSRLYQDVSTDTGFSGTPMLISDVRVARVSSDGGDFTVAMHATQAKGNGTADPYKGNALKWQNAESYTLTMTVSFNDEDLVTKVRMGDPV